MKILIEGHPYSRKDVFNICGDFEDVKDDKIKVSKVGYFYNPAIDDCVLCLPKVIKDHIKGTKEGEDTQDQNSTYLGGLRAEDIIDTDSSECKLSNDHKTFVQNFSLWTYRTISTFSRLNPGSKIVDKRTSTSFSEDDNDKQGTFLDVVCEIIEFYNRNKEYFMYVIRNIHSGYERVHWRKTIAKKTPIIQNGQPFYVDVINRKKLINFDEELMVIFYSILHYISNFLGQSIQMECNYELITGGRFETYLEGLGERRLDAIKHNYFSDKDVRLWKLCKAFFEKSSKIKASDNAEDYLFVGSFHKVFESMIDALIGEDKYQHMKVMDDGKIIDHIFKYKSPIDGQEVFYIGDSKYYAIGSQLDETSIYKQFTYAKNIIQYHFKGEFQKKFIRDDVTEGYNFIPNFFISAYVPSITNFESEELKQKDLDDLGIESKYRSFHFENRLFDRDTLYLTHFDINLLFVMMLYAQDDNIEQTAFCDRFKKKIFESVNDILDTKYNFYLPDQLDSKFIEENFKRLNGKVYPINHKKILLALDKSSDQTVADEAWLKLSPKNRLKLSDIQQQYHI